MRQIYYLARPFLSTSLRSPLQRLYFETRQKSPFPAWPVDTSADDLMNRLLFLGMKAVGIDELPFIWFWPNGANACSIMTHDVEDEVGKKFCSQLMDVNEQLGLPASFQIVPEQRYEVSPGFIDEIKRRGFEVNVQDLNHDGRLFWDYADFSNKVKRINQYARDFGAAGFRAAVLYRNEEWFNLLDFEYDMSIPNSARYDPQPGGCCTVMPYFIGNILELPVTTAQDHTVFHYLKKYSLELWREQINRIVGTHGLASFIFHPDYLIDPAALIVYKELVQELTSLQASNTLWIARPGEVNEWWRNRAAMKLVFRNGEWIIEGKGKERACVAFASIADDRIVYTVPKGKEISVS